jgi:hypothetical protein
MKVGIEIRLFALIHINRDFQRIKEVRYET